MEPEFRGQPATAGGTQARWPPLPPGCSAAAAQPACCSTTTWARAGLRPGLPRPPTRMTVLKFPLLPGAGPRPGPWQPTGNVALSAEPALPVVQLRPSRWHTPGPLQPGRHGPAAARELRRPTITVTFGGPRLGNHRSRTSGFSG